MPQMCPNCSHNNRGKQATGSCGNCGAMLRGLLGFGERVNGYAAQKVLGCGGFSAVYLAKDLKHNHDVALKELFDLDAEDIKRFEHEAAILSHLSHPQLPRFYDHFEHEGKRYLVTEFIPGQTLHDIVVEKQKSEEKVREVVAFGWALQLCDAVAYLHKEGIIHRDIKPDNVRLTPTGDICLVDLGIAKRISPGAAGVTVVHGLTQGYAPIEQHATRASRYQGRTDERTDIYALGATLYTVVTNLIPPDARALVAGTEILPPVQAIHPQISNQFAMTIERAMELMPEDRFTSVVDMKRALGEKVPHFEPTLEVSPTELDLGSVDRGESKYKDLRTIAKGILSTTAARLRSFAAHTVKRQIRKFRSGSFYISCSDNESCPVGIAADERDFLFVAWDNGVIQAYPMNNVDRPISTRFPDTGAHLKVLDICAYQGVESSGCYILLQLQAKPWLFKVDNTGKVIEEHGDLPAGICNVTCHKDQLYLYNNGLQEVDEHCKIPAGAQMISAVSEKMFPWQEYLTELSQTTVTRLGKDKLHTICCDLGIDHGNLPEDQDEQKKELIKSIESRRDSEQLRVPHSFIVGEDHLFVVGESKTGQCRHCIWVRSRFAEESGSAISGRIEYTQRGISRMNGSM